MHTRATGVYGRGTEVATRQHRINNSRVKQNKGIRMGEYLMGLESHRVLPSVFLFNTQTGKLRSPEKINGLTSGENLTNLIGCGNLLLQ